MIYPVVLSKWYPKGDSMHEVTKCIVDSCKCSYCDKDLKWRYAFGDHSLPWGYGTIWCTKRCYKDYLRSEGSKK